MTAPSTVAADFGTRFSAFMIDAVLLGAVQWVVFFVLSRQLQAVGLSAPAAEALGHPPQLLPAGDAVVDGLRGQVRLE